MILSSFALGISVAICSVFGFFRLSRNYIRIPWLIYFLLWFLPFLAGGFYTFSALLSVLILSANIVMSTYNNPTLKVVINTNTMACFVLALFYCITPIWAADRGMAMFGVLRYMPVLLFALWLIQYSNEEKALFLSILPIVGAVMTIASCILWIFPTTKDFITVNGRLSGFLQYPNTFAAFLLTGLAVLGAKQHRCLYDWLLNSVLITGIFLSGSRTAVLLLFFFLLTAVVLHKKLPLFIPVVLLFIAGFTALYLVKSVNQLTFLGRDIGSLFVRILYYKDAIPVILQHPFGLGYMGYRALETTFQTSRYTVSFVHSGLLQMLLDIGWIPSVLFAIAVIKSLISPRTTPTAKMVLLVLSAHSLIDFDLQFFLFWVILLLCLDFETGNVYQLNLPRSVRGTLTVVVLVVSIWLGTGDFLYLTGKDNTALKITPFHTNALESVLKATSDPNELDHLADKILSLNPTHALAYSAKANAAYARGQVPEMIRYKEEAIRLTPYTTEEYCDYIEKLYTVLEIYVHNGDMDSASYCLKKLLSVPDMVEAVNTKTDPLADKTGTNTDLVLPEQYQMLLSELAKANPGS